jgi:hypothetical protein
MKSESSKGGGGSTALPAPANLTATGTSTVSLSWGAVSGAAIYTVYRSTTTSFNDPTLHSWDVTTTSMTDTPATAGTYYYVVTASADASYTNESDPSNIVTVTISSPLPTAPTGLTVTGTTSSTISLSWSTVSGATGYNVYQLVSSTYTKLNTTALTSPSVNVTSLAASSTFTFKVSAINSAGESALSASVSGTTSAASTTGSFKYVNNSSYTWNSAYLSLSTSTTWGPNQITTLAPGGIFTITNVPAGTYDTIISTAFSTSGPTTGSYIQLSNIVVSAGSTRTMTITNTGGVMSSIAPQLETNGEEGSVGKVETNTSPFIEGIAGPAK